MPTGMYNIRQFVPAVYALIFLGMTGFALAAQSPAAWLIGGGGVLLNGWLVYTGRFLSLPRLVANVMTIAAMAYVANQLRAAGSNTVLVLGQFLVALQLVKLWERRANRDYGQLLVLSLLLMVAAAINTASLVFGVVMVSYLFLSLYCCLLFHLKVETDAAKSALSLPENLTNPAVLRQDQRYLTRSMRRLTGIVSAVALFGGVLVFILFPRGAGQNVLANFQLTPSQTLTGFSDEVNLTDVTRISQNNAVVAHVELFKDEQRVEGTMPLLLRGLTLDTYSSEGSGGRGQWTRTRRSGAPLGATHDEFLPLRTYIVPKVRWRQKVLLQPTGTKTLFAIPVPIGITTRKDLRVISDQDGVLQSEDPIGGQLEYEVISSGEFDLTDPGVTGGRLGRGIPRETVETIRTYALRPEVSGSNEKGSLARQRFDSEPRHVMVEGDKTVFVSREPHPLDAEIAANIEQHLRGPGFSYTLDTTDATTRAGQDPYVWFLTARDGHRGHCEYFAGAMALMCQSLGMNARVVVGFKCDEYNSTPGAGYYIVRQSHAHAWVEVLTLGEDGTPRWRTYDPTSGREDLTAAKKSTWWTRVKHFLDFLEYTYATHVIAYDNQNRDNLIQAVESKMTQPVYQGINSGWLGLRWSKVQEAINRLTESMARGAITLVLLAAAAVCGYILWRQRKLLRRAQRIGIESLPAAEQLRLAEQLGFYDDLLRLLAKHKITRPPHLTPMEFARSLLFLPSDVFEAVLRLTGVFYHVRFGRADLSPGQQRHLANVISQVEAALTASPPAAA